MNPLPVSNARLRRRQVQLQDQLLEACSILPLFDRHGLVRGLMLLAPGPRQIWWLPWRPGLVYVPWSGPVRVAEARRALREMAAGDLDSPEASWHYDPCWALDEPVWGSHPLRGEIKGSNCAGLLPKALDRLYYRRDLSRIVLIRITRKSGMELGRFKPEWLPAVRPAATPTARAPQRRTGWCLDPRWPG